jgi:dienelactone hydrolase
MKITLRRPPIYFAGLVFALCMAQSPVRAQQIDASIGETIVSVPKKGAIFTTELETTVFMPEGKGPFPLVVINHGKALGDPRFQSRYRPTLAARWFMQRGYIVVAPMRQGFSKSSGSYIGGGCNVESNGRVQAEDVKAVLDYYTAQPFVDKGNILVMGQSHGGWTTLALGTLAYPGVKGLVNFAGGLRQENCSAWEGVLATAAGSYGKETSLPSLWFYGDNDSFFSVATWKSMSEQYWRAGGKARVVAFGTFGSDAHSMFGSRNGQKIWQPEVVAFLEQVGLPARPQPGFEKYGPATPMVVPPQTGFAAIDGVAKIPFIREAGRVGYQNFLTRTSPRGIRSCAQ